MLKSLFKEKRLVFENPVENPSESASSSQDKERITKRLQATYGKDVVSGNLLVKVLYLFQKMEIPYADTENIAYNHKSFEKLFKRLAAVNSLQISQEEKLKILLDHHRLDTDKFRLYLIKIDIEKMKGKALHNYLLEITPKQAKEAKKVSVTVENEDTKALREMGFTDRFEDILRLVDGDIEKIKERLEWLNKVEMDFRVSRLGALMIMSNKNTWNETLHKEFGEYFEEAKQILPEHDIEKLVLFWEFTQHKDGLPYMKDNREDLLKAILEDGIDILKVKLLCEALGRNFKTVVKTKEFELLKRLIEKVEKFDNHTFWVISGKVDTLKGIEKVLKFMENFSKSKQEIMVFIMQNTDDFDLSHLSGIVSDPAMEYCEKVNQIISKPELALKVGRNLYLSKKVDKPEQITLELIEEEEKEIERLRKEYGEIDIWKNRNVLVLRHGEMWKNSDGQTDSRFMSNDNLKDLEKSVGEGSIKTFGPENEKVTANEINDIKDEFLKKLVETPPPMTFYFCGHGGQGALYLSGGVIGEDGLPSISKSEDLYVGLEDFSKAMIERNKKFEESHGREELSRDILIFDSCYNHNFLRSLAFRMKKEDVSIPILVGVSEYGQYGFTPSNPAITASYTVFRIGDEEVKIKDLFWSQSHNNKSDLSVYVPAEGNIKHIVEDEGEGEEGDKRV
ncbi:hypothetical protein ACFL21_02150 [Patescibacteria group bacterium]